MNNGPWVLFDTKTHLYPHGPELMLPTQYTDYASLDVKKLPPGGYKIRVYATSPDAPDTMAETNLKTVGGKGKVFIKLEAPPFEGPVFDQSGNNPWGVLHEWLG